MRIYTAWCKLFGKCLAWDKSCKTLHAQYAAALLQRKNHSANSWCNFQIHIMWRPRQTRSAHSVVLSNTIWARGPSRLLVPNLRQEDLSNKRVQISCYPIILCILLGCKMNDGTRITLAVNYPVIDFNPCNFFDSNEGTVDSKYNLIATINHKPGKKKEKMSNHCHL